MVTERFLVRRIAVSPTNINLLHSGGINTWSSADGGTNWSIQTYWNRNNTSYQWMHGDVHELVYQGNTLYEGNDGGISRTTNGGSNWVGTSTGLAISEFCRFGGTPVRVEVFDLSGKLLATLVNEKLQKAGTYTVSFDATDLPAGHYVARLTSGNQILSRSLSRMK